ncbi:MAG: hypothetical protein J7M14_02055 [Planctomycetes bacterium]|nr:hypothetical protein [Planctomycetota bacterium]
MRVFMLLAAVQIACSGCMVTQPQYTPVPAMRLVEQKTATPYWIYVPSTYDSTKPVPLVVTLHGSRLWDSSKAQIREWKRLAEDEGFIVVAPKLRASVLRIIRRGAWLEDLKRDERSVLAIMDEVCRRYSIARGKDKVPDILLTGFLEGGYPLYYIGLRNAERIGMLIARDCCVDLAVLEQIDRSGASWQAAVKLPIVVFNGKDGWPSPVTNGWKAFRFLRLNHCTRAVRKELRGGQLRRPRRTYTYWRIYRLR